jgi:hypothetical protein
MCGVPSAVDGLDALPKPGRLLLPLRGFPEANKDPPRPNRLYCARLKTRLMVVTGTDQVLVGGTAKRRSGDRLKKVGVLSLRSGQLGMDDLDQPFRGYSPNLSSSTSAIARCRRRLQSLAKIIAEETKKLEPRWSSFGAQARSDPRSPVWVMSTSGGRCTAQQLHP